MNVKLLLHSEGAGLASLAYMRLLLPGVAAILPIVIAPGLLFYFDVTPKIVVLLAGAAAGLVLWRGDLPIHSRRNRVFLALLAAQALSLLACTALSPHRALSLTGGNWRRYGLITQLAVLLYAVLIACDCASGLRRSVVYLKAIVLGAIPVGLYAMVQYFGWDPWLPKQAYHAGEATWAIVRPPSTMGHADYLATYLIYSVFAAIALLQSETDRGWRVAAMLGGFVSSAAIIASGTRAALLGLVVGAAFLALRERKRLGRREAVVAGLVVCMALIFYLSPAGQALRYRVNWIAAEPLGGARPLLWRDSLRMAVAKLGVGYGPETFATEFPRHESIDLARAYPDFLHESPHNVFLDALMSQGVPGAAILGALSIWGLVAAPPVIAAALLGGIIAQQFTSFTLPTAVMFYLTLALCIAPELAKPNRFVRIAGYCAAALLLICSTRLLVTDASLARAAARLDGGDIAGASNDYSRSREWGFPGSSSDLYYSRRLLEFMRNTRDPALKKQAWQASLEAAMRAPRTSEETANAYYNLAALLAVENDPANVERSLREAVRAAPNWYKPHWTLAQLLFREGRLADARREAEIAVTGNPRMPQVLRTLENIRNVERQ